MTWRLRISSKSLALCATMSLTFGVGALRLEAAAVVGKIDLRDSKNPSVKDKMDYSGVVVSLRPLQASAPVKGVRATITQKDKTFSPHIVAVPVGSAVDFPNVDPIFHNAFSSYSGQVFDIGLYPPGTSRTVKFTREGVVRVFCNIHSSMSAMIVVLSTPYYAISKRDGSFELENIPTGEYELNIFHERATEATLKALSGRLVVGTDVLSLPVIPISEAGYLAIPHKNKYGHDYMPEMENGPLYPGGRR